MSQVPTMADAPASVDAPPRLRVTEAVRPHLDVLVWVVVAAGALVLFDRQDVPRTFFYDEWSFIFDRRNGGIDAWLAPHNGHLTLLPAAAYRIGFALFGMDHYRPYRLMGLLAHVAVATLVYRYVRARQGRVIGVALGALFLLLGSGWEVIFQPFTINFMGAAAFGLVTWLALDRRSKVGDIAASIATGAALACSGLGIAMLIGSAARMAYDRTWRRMITVLAPPGALYAIWYLAYGQSQGSRDNLPLVPRYVVDEAASSVGGLAGRDLLWGRLLLGVLVGVVVMTVIARRAITSAVLAPLAAMLVNWILVAYSRADLGYPTSSRYVYAGAMFVILVFADVFDLSRSPDSIRRRWAPGAIVVVSLLGIWGNWRVLHDGPVDMRRATTFGRVDLRAIEWAAATVDPAYVADPLRMPGVAAGPYLAAAAELGSAAASDGEVAAIANEFRIEVDRVSLEAGRFAPVPVTVSRSCPVASVTVDDVQVVTAQLASGASIDVGATTAPVEVRLRRYGDDFPVAPTAVVDAGTAATLTLPTDTAPLQTWSLDIRSIGPIEACAAGG